MTKLNIDNKDHKFRELLTYWRKVIAERLRRKQYYEDPRYGTIVLTRREFLKLLLSLGIAGAIASLGIGMFNAHWVWAQETTNPPPTPSEYNYGELNWLELSVRGTPLGEKLVLEYLFWEGSGTILHDTSGNKFNGTIINARWIWLSNGKYALRFSGTGAKTTSANRISVPLGVYFDPDCMTIEMLLKPAADINMGFFSIDNTGGNPYEFWTTYNRGGFPRKVGVYYYGWRPQGYHLTNTTIDIGKWWHLVPVIDTKGTNTIKWYINGNLDRIIENVLPSNVGVVKLTASDVMRIACNPNYNEPFNGFYALFRLFIRPLTKYEVNILYKFAKITVSELP